MRFSLTTRALSTFSSKKIEHDARRWLELLNDYNIEIKYYLGKANVVANALSKKSTMSTACLL